MIFTVQPVIKTDGDEQLYEAVTVVSKYFAENPDEPYVNLIGTEGDETVFVRRIYNPQFYHLVESVSFAIERNRIEMARRTIDIRR